MPINYFKLHISAVFVLHIVHVVCWIGHEISPYLYEKHAVIKETLSPEGGGGTPCSGLYGEAPPESGASCKLAVYKRVGKIAILVYKMVPKSAAKWKKWWPKRSISKGALQLNQND